MWFTNAIIQFILNPCATTTYCTSYMTKIDKPIISKEIIIQKWIENTRDANTKIQKLSNTWKINHQMVVNLALSLPLYHSSQTIPIPLHSWQYALGMIPI